MGYGIAEEGHTPGRNEDSNESAERSEKEGRQDRTQHEGFNVHGCRGNEGAGAGTG